MWEKPSRQFDVTERKVPEAGQTDAAGSKGTDKAPDGRLEAETPSDDDLTVLKLGLAIDGRPHEIPFGKTETLVPKGSSHKPELAAHHSVSEEEPLLEVATRRFASTRLINVLRNAGGELPATTVAAYMRAPDAAREAFKKLENSGEKTAMELDDLVRKFACEVDQKSLTAADSIVNVVREADCSVRLLNAITAHSHRLPVDTVREYMKAPEQSRKAFLKLSNLGRKSVDELDHLLRSYMSSGPVAV